MTEFPAVPCAYVQSWDIETTGNQLPRGSDMADSIANHLRITESKYSSLFRVYDTIGFDVTNLEKLVDAAQLLFHLFTT